ncbi:MAG: DUF3570 domain-containing protein [Psychromonas sp.]
MQLTTAQVKPSKKSKHKNIRQLLKTATGCLLGATAAAQADSKESFFSGWETDIAILGYTEVDRVSAIEPVVQTQKSFDDDSVLGFKLVVDSLTGASPNGASPSDQVQTFTRPSGNGSYQTPAGETPLDDSFLDTRVSFSSFYEHGLGRMDKMIWGGNVSKEYDFFSAGLSATYVHDLNNRNTSLSLGVSGEYDFIEPVGGIPIPLTQMQAASSPQTKGEGSDTRFLGEVLIGVTQIIDRKTLVVVNYGYSQSDGYHNDPYKVTSVVDDNSGSLVQGESLSGTYLYDSRPDQRIKHSLYSKVKRAFGEDSADLSYRYMWDDWGITSHTFNLSYRKNYNAWYIEPRVRYYTQGEADFYYHSVTESQSENIGSYLTSDYRLAEMWSSTIGLKVGFKTPDGNQNSIRLEYYHQDGEKNPSNAVGVQKNYDLFPTLDAFIVQYTYSF